MATNYNDNKQYLRVFHFPMSNFVVSLAAVALVVLLATIVRPGDEGDRSNEMSRVNLQSTLTKRVFDYWFDGTFAGNTDLPSLTLS